MTVRRVVLRDDVGGEPVRGRHPGRAARRNRHVQCRHAARRTHSLLHIQATRVRQEVGLLGEFATAAVSSLILFINQRLLFWKEILVFYAIQVGRYGICFKFFFIE